jgi:hypothetical protein
MPLYLAHEVTFRPRAERVAVGTGCVRDLDIIHHLHWKLAVGEV